MQCDIGVVGLGVMGSNLALNIERHGFRVAGYDLDRAKATAFVAGPAAGGNVELAQAPDALMAILQKPRRVLVMVPAGPPVDSVIAHLETHLEPGDILIDGGNSFFLDTERRSKALAEKGFNYIGTGVSGGRAGRVVGTEHHAWGTSGGLGCAGSDPSGHRGQG
jgi:6-phosphogluconate dehydrogenase